MHNCQECKHENITFCPKCQKVYCVDCGREWEDKCTLNHYYPWYVPSYTTTGTVYQGVTWTTLTCPHA